MTSDLLAEMQIDGYSGTRKATTRGGEWQGPCILPCCDGLGKDRLRVQPGYGTHGYFECRVCNSKGSLIDYLMIKRGYGKQQALMEVGWRPQDGSEPHFIIPQSILAGRRQASHEAPPREWQEAAKSFAKYCEDILWSERGKEALSYLRSRGLKDETIRTARLGYNPIELQRPGAKWGNKKTILLYQGIVIPWFLGEDEIWRLSIRDRREKHYRQVTGGSNGLYLGSLLGYDRPVILAEGEIDALSIAQEAGHSVLALATGSTEGSRTAKWIVELAQKDMVLVAFDADEKGDEAASWWLDRLENAHRLRPWWDDANQMLQDGIDLLNDWILPVIDTVLAERTFVESTPSLPDDCQLCGTCLDQAKETVAIYSHEEDLFCIDHYPPLQGLHSFICKAQEDIPTLNVEFWPIENSERMKESILRKYRTKEQPRGPYSPVSLPPLPRQACPCLTIDWAEAKGNYRKQVRLPCRNTPIENGFCEGHQVAHKILEIGARFGYPQIPIPFAWKRTTLQRTIHSGVECWEGHVCTLLVDKPQAHRQALAHLEGMEARHASDMRGE